MTTAQLTNPGTLVYRSIYGTTVGVTEVLNYWTNPDGHRFATAVTDAAPNSAVHIPLRALTATRPQRGLGLKPVPWG